MAVVLVTTQELVSNIFHVRTNMYPYFFKVE